VCKEQGILRRGRHKKGMGNEKIENVDATKRTKGKTLVLEGGNRKNLSN